MIVFFESGRLGNQLFQYAALSSVRVGGERLILVGFKDLAEVFIGVNAKIIQINGISPSLVALIYRTLKNIPGRRRLFGSLNEGTSDTGWRTERNMGMLLRLIVAGEAYYQSPHSFNPELLSHLRIRENLVQRADSIISSLACSERTKICVHIRRGDYLSYPSKKFAAALPASWFKRTMTEMRQRYVNPLFFMFSDDELYIRDVFGEYDDVKIFPGSVGEDFALMVACDGCIISASSLGWWAAHFMRRRQPDAPIIAPEYWMGHRRSEWHPEGIQTHGVEYR